jgi:hypothetical protein
LPTKSGRKKGKRGKVYQSEVPVNEGGTLKPQPAAPKTVDFPFVSGSLAGFFGFHSRTILLGVLTPLNADRRGEKLPYV